MPLVSKNFSDIITFTRASTATYFNSSGVLTSAAIDAPRLDYNPSTLAAQGLLIEEARTNSIRNNTMQGAVAGTPGTLPTNWFVYTGATGLTTSVVGSGTENGIAYVDVRMNGTAAGGSNIIWGFDSNTSIAASNGQTWAQSAYVKIQGGTTTGIVDFRIQNDERSASTYLRTNASPALAITTAALNTQRYSFSATLSGGGTVAFVVPYFLINFTVGVAIDITLRIGLPQLEQGAFATSVIPTTTTALTRNADVANVNTLAPWYNATEGTLFAEAVYFGLAAPTTVAANQVRFFDGTGSNIITLRNVVGTGSPNADEVIANSGTSTMDTVGVTISANTIYKRALGYKANDGRAAINGSYTDPVDTTVTVPVVNALNFGFASGVYGYWIRRITYYPRRVSDAELLTLTA